MQSKGWSIFAYGFSNLHKMQRWGPYNRGNLPKVRSRYCAHEILPWPSKVEIKVVCNDLFSHCTTGYKIWDNFNFPMSNPHWQLCKYGPHLGVSGCVEKCRLCKLHCEK